jgi:hypothetical protein
MHCRRMGTPGGRLGAVIVGWGVASLVVMGALASPAVAGKSGPSQYCKTFIAEGQKLQAEFSAVRVGSSRNPFSSAVAVLSSPAELSSFFSRLAAVAPGTIRRDLEAISSAFRKVSSSLGSGPATFLGTSLAVEASSYRRTSTRHTCQDQRQSTTRPCSNSARTLGISTTDGGCRRLIAFLGC